MIRRLLGRSERGNQLAEFGVILPLILILALGSVDLGRALITYTELEQAAQEGALFASFRPDDYDLVTQRVRTSSSGIVDLSDATRVDIRVLCSPDVPAGKVGITIRFTLEIVTPLVDQFIGESIPLETRSIGTNFFGPDTTCEPTP